MTWSEASIRKHERAARLLSVIFDETFRFLAARKGVSEYDAAQFILTRIKEQGLTMDGKRPIVAFGRNTRHVHYLPDSKSSHLKPGMLLLLDIWARLKESKASPPAYRQAGAGRKATSRGPYADITQMAYFGAKIPSRQKKIFSIVMGARNAAVRFIRQNLKRRTIPKGCEIDAVAREVITRAGYGKHFSHSTGHGLGFTHPHGRGVRIGPKGKSSIHKAVGYTIEPGIYLKDFGIRSEIDFHIAKGGIVVTTPVQKQIRLIKPVK